MWVIMWFYRPKWEGGEYEGEDEPRFEALQLAMELGAEYVDIELKVGPEYTFFSCFDELKCNALLHKTKKSCLFECDCAVSLFTSCSEIIQ